MNFNLDMKKIQEDFKEKFKMIIKLMKLKQIVKLKKLKMINIMKLQMKNIEKNSKLNKMFKKKISLN